MQKITNYPKGQNHFRAELSDREIGLMRELHEEYPVGDSMHLGYRKLAIMFGCSRSAVRYICKYAVR